MKHMKGIFRKMFAVCTIISFTTANIGLAGNDFFVTSNTYSEKISNNQACKNEYGSQMRIADWNDVKSYYNSHNSMDSFFNKVGMPPKGSANQRSLRVSRNGSEMYSSSRHYYITRHDHSKPGYYLAHSNIDNYLISLGSWYGNMNVLCYGQKYIPPTPAPSGDISVMPAVNILLGSKPFTLFSNPKQENPFAFVVSAKNSQEKFGAVIDRSGSKDEVAGIAYTTPDGKNAFVTVDSGTGLPKAMIDYNGYQITFTNYTSTTVKLTLLSPQGDILTEPIIHSINHEEINEIKSLFLAAVPSGKLALSKSFFGSDRHRKLIRWGGLVMNWAGCGLAIGATWGTFGFATGVAIASCGSAIMSTWSYATRDPADDEIAFAADSTNCLVGIGLCSVGSGADCVGLLSCAVAMGDIATWPTDESRCVAQGGYWYNSKCSSTPPPTCDANHLNLCSTSTTCFAAGGDWYNNQCNASKPSPAGTVWYKGELWQETSLAVSGYSQNSARAYCNNLSLGGYSWRLPELNELKEIILCTNGHPSDGRDCSSDGYPDQFKVPTADDRFIFPANPKFLFLASNAQGSHNYGAGISYKAGYTSHPVFNYTNYGVRCIRK